jgi:hypothetical protein
VRDARGLPVARLLLAEESLACQPGFGLAWRCADLDGRQWVMTWEKQLEVILTRSSNISFSARWPFVAWRGRAQRQRRDWLRRAPLKRQTVWQQEASRHGKLQNHGKPIILMSCSSPYSTLCIRQAVSTESLSTPSGCRPSLASMQRALPSADV